MDKELLVSTFVDGNVISIEPCGNGLINETYRVKTSNGSYILQKINTNIFDAEKVMSNIAKTTKYISDNNKGQIKTLEIVKTKSGELYYKDYRMYIDIAPSVCYDRTSSPEIFEKCGYAFGKFASAFDKFDAKALYETIPDFHNTPARFMTFKKAIETDMAGRARNVEKEISFFLNRQTYSKSITSLLEKGIMPMRVTHNDTKLNNVLFSESGEPIAIVDLDTVMPGSVCYDFGDGIRFGCNTAAEDEPDIEKVDFSFELFGAFTKGYLEGFPEIEQIEVNNLVQGAITMTFECGMRFLTDYLNGDTYFKVTRDRQNLDRARTQIKMVELIEKNYAKLKKIVSSCTAN